MQEVKSKDSHYVPKTYLKRFTKKNGKLFKLKKDLNRSPRAVEVHPSGICYQKGFYEFSSQHPIQGYIIDEPNYLEDKGFLYENRLGRLIDKVISPTGVVTKHDAYSLGAMLFNLKVRNPYYREKSFSDLNINASIDSIIAEQEQKRETGESVAQLRNISQGQFNAIIEGLKQEWLTDKGVAKELHNRSLLENLFKPSEARKWIYYNLASSQWLLLKTTMNYQFISSDNPGYCQDEHNRIYNTKFAGRGSVQ